MLKRGLRDLNPSTFLCKHVAHPTSVQPKDRYKYIPHLAQIRETIG